MHPGKNSYPVEQQVSNEVAIRSDWLTGEDLFLITEQVNANGTIDFKAIVNPLVNLIWLAGLVFLLGSVDRRSGRTPARSGGSPCATGACRPSALVLTAALVLGGAARRRRGRGSSRGRSSGRGGGARSPSRRPSGSRSRRSATARSRR